jgi:hypothetical protein
VPSNDSFEFDYTPGYTKPTHEYGAPFGDEFHAESVQELLLSTVGYSQRGVTLLGGQGVLPTGTVLAKQTSSGKYVIFDPAALTGAGAAVALGILRDSRDTGSGANGPTGNANPVSPAGKAAGDCQGNLVYRGILNANLISGTDTTSLLPAGQTGGGIGSGANGAYTQLKPRIIPFGSGAGTAPQGGQPFPGGPMDGMSQDGGAGTVQGVNAWVF